MGPLCIPNMPEMMVALREQYPDCDLEHANSLLSGMLMAGFGAGQAIGPLLGSFMYQISDFQTTQNVVSLIAFATALLYFVFA